jgi:hypothetical protein
LIPFSKLTRVLHESDVAITIVAKYLSCVDCGIVGERRFRIHFFCRPPALTTCHGDD